MIQLNAESEINEARTGGDGEGEGEGATEELDDGPLPVLDLPIIVDPGETVMEINGSNADTPIASPIPAPETDTDNDTGGFLQPTARSTRNPTSPARPNLSLGALPIPGATMNNHSLNSDYASLDAATPMNTTFLSILNVSPTGDGAGVRRESLEQVDEDVEDGGSVFGRRA